jgi:hypothetical protein
MDARMLETGVHGEIRKFFRRHPELLHRRHYDEAFNLMLKDQLHIRLWNNYGVKLRRHFLPAYISNLRKFRRLPIDGQSFADWLAENPEENYASGKIKKRRSKATASEKVIYAQLKQLYGEKVVLLVRHNLEAASSILEASRAVGKERFQKVVDSLLELRPAGT